MAIQFPPVDPGDAEPIDGEEYLYLVTGEVFVYRRRDMSEAAQWAALGAVQDVLLVIGVRCLFNNRLLRC